MSKLSLKSDLSQILKQICSRNSQLKDLVAHEDVLDKIINLLQGQSESDHHQSLPNFLNQDCGIKYRDIRFLINELSSNSTSLAILSQKITKLWLTMYIFELVDGLKPTQSQKRKKIQDAFKSYQFQAGNLEDLIQVSFKSVEEPFQKDDIANIANDLMAKKPDEIAAMFEKKQKNVVDDQAVIQYARKSVEEQLNDLIADYKIYPEESFEKILQAELICAYAHKFSIKGEINQHLSIISQLGQLKNEYKKFYGSLSSEIEELFKKISNKDNKNIYESLFTLKTKICPIDVFELRRLIEKTNHSKELIKGKDVIFVIGNTGSGKSTNILKLLGYKLRQGEFNGLKTLVPVQKLSEHHKTFYTSPQGKSCTRYINVATVPDKMYPKGTLNSKKTLELCDSPGFGDSAGVQVDIANGVGMINALHGANSVRVVVILPYHSLLGDRMDGAIKMGEIISNLFYDLSVLESVKIYFNQVPKDEIKQIQQKINDKINHLTQNQQCNEKLTIFLNQVLQSSRTSSNFLNPIQGDYKRLFQQIFKMSPIQDAKKTFQYQFTDSTKKQIDKFAQEKKFKVKDFFMNAQYEHSQFHLKTLEIMKNILVNTQKLKNIFQYLISFIENESANKFVQYEQYITEIIYCRNNSSTETKLKDCEKNIIQIYNHFHEFQGIQLASKEKIHKLIVEKKKKFLAQVADFSDITIQTISAVKTFSKILSPSFEQQVADIIEKQFSLSYQEIEKLAKNKDFSQMNDKIQKLTIFYKYIIKINQLKSSSTGKMEELRIILEKQVQEGFKTINQIIGEPPRLNKKMIDEANKKIQTIKQIQSLKFLEKSQDIREKLNALLKQIEAICKKTVRELDNVRLTLNEQVQSNGNIEENQLSSKKKAIEFLMKIDCIGENLKEDYEYVIENISRKLKQNVEILRNGIAALKGNKTEEIYRNLQNIKKATAIVLRCSKIVDKGEESNQLALSIQSEFMTFLNGEIDILRNFEIKMTRIIQENYFDKILEQCRKIQTYAKMGIIGDKIKDAVKRIRQQFKGKLNTPFKEFLDKQIFNIQEKKSYKFLTYSLDKLQKLSLYLFQTEDNLPLGYRSQIKDSEILLADKLRPFFQSMEKDVIDFIQTQFDITSRPPSLKELVKILLAVSMKNKTCQFLSLRIDFNIEDHIGNIERKLKQFMEHLEAIFNSNTKATQLQVINECCKYYSQIEQYYKQSKFGFKQLQRQCSLAFTKSLQHDEDRIKALIRDISPTKIAFQYLKTYYQQFRALKGPQGAKKRRFIVDELKIVEKNCKNDLNKFKKEMDDPDFINKDDFLKAFQEANVLVKHLEELYTQNQDKQSILIQKKDIKQIGIKIISVFQSKFETVYKQIMDYNLSNIEYSLKIFGSLQSIIYDAYPIEIKQHQVNAKNQIKQQQNEEKRLKEYIISKIIQLRSIFDKKEYHRYLKDYKSNAENTNKLKILLDYLRKGIQNLIKQRYNTLYTMQFDEEFQKYYSHCNKQQKQQINSKINQKMEMLFQQYKQKSTQSGEVAQAFSKDIIQPCFIFLPSQLNTFHRKDFRKLKEELISHHDSEVENALKLFSNNPSNNNIFFTQSKLAMDKKIKPLHEKYVSKFELFFEQSNFSSLDCEKKVNFINKSILNVFLNNRHYFYNDEKMLIVLIKRLCEYLKVLVDQGCENIKRIKQFIQNSQRQQRNVIFKQKIDRIFFIYEFFLSIKDDFFAESNLMQNNQERYNARSAIAQFKKCKQLSGLESQILQINQQLLARVAKRPNEKLNTIDFMDPKRMKTVQAYIQCLKNCGLIQDCIIQKLRTIRQKQQPVLTKIQFKKSYYNQILKQYQNQMKMMYSFVEGYQFYSEKKRNMTPRKIQEDINQLNTYYLILTERRQFFQSYIISQNQEIYNFDGLKTKISQRFEALAESTKNQIAQIFQNCHGDPATKVNLLVSQLQFMCSKEIKFIQMERVKFTSEIISKLIKSQFQRVRSEANERFCDLKQSFDDVNKKIMNLQVKKAQDIQSQNTKFETQLEIKSKNIQDSYKHRINLQTTEDRITYLKNAMKGQINSHKKDLNDIKVKKIEQIQKKYNAQIQNLYENLNAPIEKYTKLMKIIKRALIDISCQTEKRADMVQALLVGIQKIKPKYIRMIENKFASNIDDSRSIGKQILTSCKIFTNYQVTLINKLIKGQDINYVTNNLEKITVNGRQKMKKDELDSIQSCYALFKKKFDELKEKYKNNPTDTTINYMVQPLQTLGKQIRDDFYFSKKPTKSLKNKIQLLAGIFAIWVVLKSQVFQGDVEFTIEPHPTQITTLILLLGISQPNEQLGDRLAQVGTGEGKSIVLAGLSCYLALVGFKVRCACYSAYLSGRDQESFKFLFSKLDIQNQIKYGTFHELCEDILNSGDNDLKQSVEKIIFHPKGFMDSIINAFVGSSINLNKGANDPTILVIDQVDVFFDNSFFGKSYCPGITLKDPTVTAMLQLVWKEVNQNQKDVLVTKLLESQQFKNLVDRYPNLKAVLQNQVHGMIAGALNYKHDYVIVNQKIGYIDSDFISFKINYGYKTVFANMLEYDQGKISRQSLDESLQICLMIAEFSYARLPEFFKNILGVTGTLEVLPKYKKEQLARRYRITDQFAIPSAFGINKRRIENFTIKSKEDFYQSIINKINQVQHNRPIIIFFKSSLELNQFYNDVLFEPYQARANSLTEEHEPSIRDSRIVRAVDPKNITLMTNSFGRGTDFVLLDDKIKENGGLHVIQAFLSLDESQEVQIKGRTARQSGKGSYDCVINENWLEQLDLKSLDIQQNATSNDIHNTLLKARESKIEKQAVSTLNALKISDEMHEKTVKIFTKPKLPQSDLIDYIAGLNKYPEIRKTVIKTVLGLDATGSMSRGLQKTCQIIGNAFTETYAVLQQKKVQATIEIKIMVYRNYNSPKEEILQSTTFENTPANLKSFLERVKPKGGWKNQALQVLFQSLNKEKKIDQVILIGDAAPNTVSEVQSKRKDRGTDYWTSNGFPATHIDKELSLFINKKCPVHSFYLNNGIGFKQISMKTQGQSAPFNINSPNVTRDLSSFVVINILKLIEKNSGNSSLNLVQAYRKMFP